MSTPSTPGRNAGDFHRLDAPSPRADPERRLGDSVRAKLCANLIRQLIRLQAQPSQADSRRRWITPREHRPIFARTAKRAARTHRPDRSPSRYRRASLTFGNYFRSGWNHCLREIRLRNSAVRPIFAHRSEATARSIRRAPFGGQQSAIAVLVMSCLVGPRTAGTVMRRRFARVLRRPQSRCRQRNRRQLHGERCRLHRASSRAMRRVGVDREAEQGSSPLLRLRPHVINRFTMRRSAQCTGQTNRSEK